MTLEELVAELEDLKNQVGCILQSVELVGITGELRLAQPDAPEPEKKVRKKRTRKIKPLVASPLKDEGVVLVPKAMIDEAHLPDADKGNAFYGKGKK